MSRPTTILRSIAAVSLILTMFAAVSVTGSAQIVNPDTFPDFFTTDEAGTNSCYYASVSNGEDFGLGASMTSITVQNLDASAILEGDSTIYIWTGTGDGFDEAAHANLGYGASKTFTAADLGISSGSTVPVAVAGYDYASSQAGDFEPEDGVAIGCVAKQAVAGGSLPYTTASDTSVSGYNATSGREVGFFDELYFPIVQTNCGPGGCWNTVLRVANVGPFDNAAVTVRFFPADDGSGSLQTGFQLEGLLNQGELWSINLADWVPEGWVGSAHVYTDDSVVAIADRYKAGTDMWITNTAANAVAESNLQVPGGPANAPYVLYAPDIRLDYNGWNTGISVANTVNWDNTVHIQYFGNNGNAPQAQSQRLAAHGMTYFYNPSSPSEDECEQPADQVPTCDFVGAAIVLSDDPVAVAVDGVKYYGNDANVGQAFSYSATGNVHNWQAAPLVQKGSPATGMGATSGITFLNPHSTATYITVDWMNPSGFGAGNFNDTIVWVPGFSTGFVYTMFDHNLPNGFSGSALVMSDLGVAATTANVDYQVQGDGTAIWTLYNPCGLYRQVDDCPFYVEPELPATKTFSVRPADADALICVYDSVSGQDGKPIPPDEDCVIERVPVKADNEGGQDSVATYIAGGVTVSVDDATNTITTDAGGSALLGVLVEFNIDTLSYEPSGDMATCTDYGSQDLWVVSVGGQISGTDFGLLSADFENTILIVDGTCYGTLEAGYYRDETPAEAQARLGTVVPPFGTDASGWAEVELPAGCYFFVVSADGYYTHVSTEECLEAGETLHNIIDLDPIVPLGTGFLDKTFCELSGEGCDPVEYLVVWAYNLDHEDIHLEVGPTDTYGEVFAELTAGDYMLCWADSDLMNVYGVPVGYGEGYFVSGCEVITIVAGETLYMTNYIEQFAVLDICVRDEDQDLPLPGATVDLFDQWGYYLGTGTTGADGEVQFLVDADYNTVFRTNASKAGYEDETATALLNSEDPDEDCDANGQGGDTDHALNPVGLGSFGNVTKTVYEDELALAATPNWGVTVQVVEGNCPAVGGTIVAMGVTDELGVADLTVLEGNYCLQVLAADGGVAQEENITVTAGVDTAFDNFLTTPVIALVQNLGAVGDPGDFVYVFLATPNDLIGGGSGANDVLVGGADLVCLGTWVATVAFDDVTGIAAFPVAAGANYCVASDASDGGFYDAAYLSTTGAGIDVVLSD